MSYTAVAGLAGILTLGASTCEIIRSATVAGRPRERRASSTSALLGSLLAAEGRKEECCFLRAADGLRKPLRMGGRREEVMVELKGKKKGAPQTRRRRAICVCLATASCPLRGECWTCTDSIQMANHILVGAHLSSLYSPPHIRTVPVHTSARNIPLPPPPTESDLPPEHCLHASTFYSHDTGTIYVRLLHDGIVLELLSLTNETQPIRFLFPTAVIPSPSISILDGEIHILVLTSAGSLYRLAVPFKPPRLWSEPSTSDWCYEYHLKNPQILTNAVVQAQDLDTVLVGLANGSLLRLTCNTENCEYHILHSVHRSPSKPIRLETHLQRVLTSFSQFHGMSSQSTRLRSYPALRPSFQSITLLQPTPKLYPSHPPMTTILSDTLGPSRETAPYAFGRPSVVASPPKHCSRLYLLDETSLLSPSVPGRPNPLFFWTPNHRSCSASFSSLHPHLSLKDMPMFLLSSQLRHPPHPAVFSSSSPQLVIRLRWLTPSSARRQVRTLICETSPWFGTNCTPYGIVKACPRSKLSISLSEKPKRWIGPGTRLRTHTNPSSHRPTWTSYYSPRAQ